MAALLAANSGLRTSIFEAILPIRVPTIVFAAVEVAKLSDSPIIQHFGDP
jgi:hypothetical protein